MWSAITVALLCMIVNWIEGKQGSGPKGDKVLYSPAAHAEYIFTQFSVSELQFPLGLSVYFYVCPKGRESMKQVLCFQRHHHYPTCEDEMLLSQCREFLEDIDTKLYDFVPCAQPYP